LKGDIIKSHFTIESFSKTLGMDKSQLSRRMNGEVRFTREEIKKISEVLEISQEEVWKIFFASKVA
jgi:transcriptional regulator with XRE-family HTH domain